MILVDDGSTDGSSEICDNYTAKDHRIHVVHQPNKGRTEARKVGVNKATGEWLPGSTLDACRECLVSIKGPLTTPVGGGIRSINVAMRQELDLYVCLRPVRWLKGVPSPVKHPELTDMVIFRENTEDIYAGIEWMNGTPEADRIKKFLLEEMGVKKIRFPETASIGVKPVSLEGTERLVRAAL